MEFEDHASRWLESASDLYDQVVFNTDAVFNKEAPQPWIAFMLGGIFFAASAIMWLQRLMAIKKDLGDTFQGSVIVRAMLSALVDSDEPFYTIASMAATSFFFLGGLQLHYATTFSVMLGFFSIVSLADTLRVLLAFRRYQGLSDVVVTSNLMGSKMNKVVTELSPSNVYEDLGRDRTVVSMVFITQVILIAFVVTDVYDSKTNSCRDGSKNCPAVGTLGSWGFYVLGIFMACVYLLGPKSGFGQSEQNPAYWLQLLLVAKGTGAKCTWYDPVARETKERQLSPDDIRIWARFFMSYLINGVGFHILVHALPIQVATQSSLTGVVFRAVGMIYLVDLDDTAGYKLTLVEKPAVEEPKVQEVQPEPVKAEYTAGQQTLSDAQVSDEAQKIIEEAKFRLDALARGGISSTPAKSSLLAGALLMATTESGAAAQQAPSADTADAEEGGAEAGADGGGDA